MSCHKCGAGIEPGCCCFMDLTNTNTCRGCGFQGSGNETCCQCKEVAWIDFEPGHRQCGECGWWFNFNTNPWTFGGAKER